MKKLIIILTVALCLVTGICAASDKSETATATTDAGGGTYAQGQFKGRFNVSVSGSWVGTVKLQRSWDRSTWVDVATWTSNIQTTVDEPELVYYRVGLANGSFSSGTCNLRLSQ